MSLGMDTPAEQIAAAAYDLVAYQFNATHTPEMKFLLLLKTLSWEDIEAEVIAACRRKAGL